MNCPHQPPCPPADAPDCEAACVVAAHPEQGWSLLCNHVVVFEDTGDLLPDGRIIAPHRTELDVELLALCGTSDGRAHGASDGRRAGVPS
jgi:hypothetical protein